MTTGSRRHHINKGWAWFEAKLIAVDLVELDGDENHDGPGDVRSVVESASKLELQAYVRMIELNVGTHLCHLHSNFPLAFALLLSKQSGGRRHLSLALSDRRMRGETSGGDSEEPCLAS